MTDASLQTRFSQALDRLVESVQEDRSILAAILCGSLAHDAVWARSDIDLVLVTSDDKKPAEKTHALWADGVNVHALLMPRAELRKAVEGSLGNSFFHSFLAKGRLLYTHDETIAALCARLHEMGERDLRLQLLRAGCAALSPVDKAHKWLLTRGDLDYCALWVLYAATPLARIEVLEARQLADREVIPQALALNPAFFGKIYTDLLNGKKSAAGMTAVLETVDRYLEERTARLFAPLIEHLREVGEARSSSELEAHFERNFDTPGVTIACEYLAERGILGKAAVPVRLTRRSNVAVEELAFFYLEASRDGR